MSSWSGVSNTDFSAKRDLKLALCGMSIGLIILVSVRHGLRTHASLSSVRSSKSEDPPLSKSDARTR